MLASLQLALTLLALSFLAFPLVALICPQLPGRGWAASPIVGILMLTYTSWLFAAMGVGRHSFVVALALIAVVSAGLWWHYRPRATSDLALGQIAWTTLSFLGLYVGLCLFRGLLADVTTGEKYMDLGFINSIALAPQVPPRDMWFAGLPINYYYLGHWTWAALAAVARVDTLDIFVLTIPVIATISALQVWYLVRTVLHTPRWAAFVALWCLLWAGTPGAARYIAQAAVDPTVPVLSSAMFLGPALQIVDPAPVAGPVITEFPAFSFLLGDVHAHVMAVPLLFLEMILLLQRFRSLALDRISWRQTGIWYACFGLVMGVHYALNSVDLPLVFGLVALVEMYAIVRAGITTVWAWIKTAGRVLGMGAWAMLCVWPFARSFEPFTVSPDVNPALTPLPGPLSQTFAWTPIATSLHSFLAVAGFLVLLILLSLLIVLRRQPAPLWIWAVCAASVVLGLWRPMLSLIAPLLVLTVYSTINGPRSTRIAGILSCVALVLWIAPEIVMIRDLTGRRMNTVFKWYFQAWILIVVALPVYLAWSYQHLVGRLRHGWLVLVGLCIAGGSVYTPVAALHLVGEQGSRWWGIDGLAQVEARHPDEAAAITWLRGQPDSGGVLELHGNRDEGISQRLVPSRVSALTGRPTLQGWSKYVWFWHNLITVTERQILFANASSIQTRVFKGDVNSVRAACSSGHIHYIYVGYYERRGMQESLQLNAAPYDLELVFDRPTVQIYRCPSLSVAIQSVQTLYPEETSAGLTYWAQEPKVMLRIQNDTFQQVVLRGEVFAPRDGVVVTMKPAGQPPIDWTAGTVRREIQMLVSVPPGGVDIELQTSIQPTPLGTQDTRLGTIGMGLFEVVVLDVD